MNAILAQLSNSPDPQVFASQFNQLMSQRNLVATPQGYSGNFQVPSKEQAKYIKDELDQRVQALTAPVEMGGQGMSPFQARVQAINEAKQAFNVDPRYLAAWGAAAGPGGASTEADAGGKTTTGSGVPAGNDGNVAFGPDRAAKITPDKIAEILTRQNFQDYMKWADAYKQTAAGVANAKDFAKYVMAQNLGSNQSQVEAQKQAIDLARTSGGQDAANTLYQIRNSTKLTLTPAEQKMIDGILKTGQGPDGKPVVTGDPKAVDKALAYFEKELPSTKDIQQATYDWFTKHAHELSVAAALNQLY